MSGRDDEDREGQEDELLDDGEEIDDDDRVVLVDDEGNERAFVVLAVAEVNEVDYALLAPEDQMSEEGDGDLELFIFRYVTDDDGNETFAGIEDDSVYEEVHKVFAELMNLDGEDDGEEAPEA
jgi:uncharacterized protein YrzB (UPF0473 family)